MLTSNSPLEENTLKEPTKVSPKTEDIKLTGSTLVRQIQGNSFTIIRLKTSKQ